MINPDSPTPFLQFQCITIKTTVPTAPVKLESPPKAYNCIGQLAKAYRLPFPEEKPTLQAMMSDLKNAIDNRPAPSNQAEKIIQILFDFNRDDVISNRTRDIMEYAYEHEK